MGCLGFKVSRCFKVQGVWGPSQKREAAVEGRAMSSCVKQLLVPLSGPG